MWIKVVGIILLLLGLYFRKIRKDKQNQSRKKENITNNQEKQNLKEPESTQSRKTSEDDAHNLEGKSKKSKPKKDTDPSLDITDKEFIGSIKAPGIEAIDIKNSKMLIATSNNELQLFDLKELKKENPTICKKGYQLLDSRGTAVFVGTKYLYVALEGEKTVIVYQFIGQNGIYFKQVCRLPKYIHNSEILSIYSDEKDQFILTVGSGADTTIKLFSLKGNKLHETNTSQVQHYKSKIVEDVLCLRSWAPSYKMFKVVKDKKSQQFSSLEKSVELSHKDGVIDGSIDVLGRNGVTIRKDMSICVWKLDFNLRNSSRKKQESSIRQLQKCKICEVHSIQTEDGRIRSIICLSDGRSLFLTDLQLNIRKIFNLPQKQQNDIEEVVLVGKKTLVVFGIVKKSGRVYMWNGTQTINSTDKYEQ